MDDLSAAPCPSRRDVLAGACAVATVAAGNGARAAPAMPATAVRRFAIGIGPGVIRYRTEAGEIPIANAAGEANATIFAASYIAENLGPSARRPVSFVFNGGPGGASWPLHTTISPKRIAPAGTAAGYAIAPNADSPIDQTDLVFVDAPGTGFSRMLTEAARTDHWGIEQDARAVSLYIEAWLRTHGRQASPVYLVGESYGGTRIAQILRIIALRGRRRVAGIVLISPTLGGNEPFLEGMDGDAMALPTIAAASRWYGRGAYCIEPVEAVWARACAFAAGPYGRILSQGGHASPDEMQAIVAQLAAFTGMAPDLLVRSGLRVPIDRYRDLLLAEEGERIRLSDARQHAPLPAAGAPASVVQTGDGYDLQAAILDLMRRELGYATAAPYRRDPGEAGRMWDNRRIATPWRLTDVARAVADADPAFGILLVGGHFDMVVPHFGTQAAFDKAGLPPSRFRNIVYPAGHAVYSDPMAGALAVQDLRAFYRDGAGLRGPAGGKSGAGSWA